MIAIKIPCAERLERYRDVVPDWKAFIEALSRPLPGCLWTNTLRTSTSRLADLLEGDGINAEPLGWYPDAFKNPSGEPGQSLPFAAGLFQIQEEASLLPVVLLDPQPGERVLDLCSAPGNKTAQMAVAMRNTGTIVANDRDPIRTRATRGTLDRLGIINTTVTVADAARFPVEAGLFDRVLADVPCTCEGTTRKHASALVSSGRDVSLGMHGLQTAILRRAVELCRPGGRVVYATCTFAPEENEVVVDRILHEFGGAVSLLPVHIPGLASSPGLTFWNGRRMHASLAEAVRIWPHQNDTGGFFCAVLEKEGPPAAVGAPIVPATDESGDWIAFLEQRFGIDPSVFDSMTLMRPSNKYVTVTARDHQSIDRPEPVSVGMPLIRAALKYPKLTTPGARLLGPYARKNVIRVSRRQAGLYLARENVEPMSDQKDRLTGTGYVMVVLEEVVLGVGIYHADQNRISSMFPKEHSRGANVK